MKINSSIFGLNPRIFGFHRSVDSKHVGTPCTIFRDLVLRNKIKGNTAPYVLPYSKTQKMVERGLLNALKKKQMCKNEILHTFLATNTKV